LGRMVAVGDASSLWQAVDASVRARRKPEATGRWSHLRRVEEAVFIRRELGGVFN
jgi:hypothetical protein